MKKIVYILSVLCVLSFSSCREAEKEYYVSSSFREPATDGLRFIYSEDGIHWDSIAGTWLAPEVGKQRVMRDPSIVRDNQGTYHLVWTSSWRGDLGFGYSSSKDLINWSPEQFIPAMAYDTTTVNVWAPELFYDNSTEEFMIIWASCIPGKFDLGMEDEKNNHRLYYTKTRDFKSFSATELFYDPGYSAIDAVLVKRQDDDYVIVVKDNTRPNRNIKVAFGNAATGPFGPTSEPFTSEFCEGPSVAKVGDYYYIYYDAYREKIYAASKTRDFKTFEDATSEVSFPEGHKHGTIFKAPEHILRNLIQASKAL